MSNYGYLIKNSATIKTRHDSPLFQKITRQEHHMRLTII